MSNYPDLDKLINEYEEDSLTIRRERLIMKNYPKILVMSAASTFECRIKKCCQNFLDDPKLSIITYYPNIESLRKKTNKKPLVDKMFALLEGYIDSTSGVEHLSALNFYGLFNGSSFKIEVENNCIREKNLRIKELTVKNKALFTLLGKGDQYDYDYVRNDDLINELGKCSFMDMENAFLGLKLRRNKVAHDYLNGLTDTFQDVQKFYDKAVIYVDALNEAIKDLTL